MIRVIAGCIALLAPALAPAFANPPSSQGQEHARHAAAAAKADPRPQPNGASLDAILADAQRRYPGDVIDVAYDDGEFEIEIRQANGRVVDLDYAASTGKFLKADPD